MESGNLSDSATSLYFSNHLKFEFRTEGTTGLGHVLLLRGPIHLRRLRRLSHIKGAFQARSFAYALQQQAEALSKCG